MAEHPHRQPPAPTGEPRKRYYRARLEITATPEILGHLVPLAQKPRRVAIKDAPDLLIVNVSGGGIKVENADTHETRYADFAHFTIPVAIHPLDEIGAFDVVLMGGPQRFHIRGGTPTPSPEEWAALVVSLRERNAVLKLKIPRTEPISTGPAKMPSALVQLEEAIPSAHTALEKRTAALVERATIHEIPVDGAGILQRKDRQITVDLVGGDRPLQANLPFDHAAGAVTGPASELARLCIERLARFDSYTYADLLSLIDIAVTHHNPMLAINTAAEATPDGAALVSWTDLGRRRGWLQLDKYNRGKRLRESVELLTSIHFTIDLKSKHNIRLNNVPLFTRVADIDRYVHGQPKRAGVVIALNPMLWQVMVDEQRAVLYDPAILTSDLRHQEWEFRIYLYLSGRWSMSWQHDKLFLKRGEMSHRLSTMLERSGLDYADQLTKKGPSWLRDKVKAALTGLAKKQWGTPTHALISKWTYKPGESVLSDTVTVWPTEAAIDYLNNSRTASLAAVQARLISDAPKRPN